MSNSKELDPLRLERISYPELACLKILNRPPLVAEFLVTYPGLSISPEQFETINHNSHQYQLSAILATLVRVVDRSAFVPNLITPDSTKESILFTLSSIGQRSLNWIKQQESQLKDEIFSALFGIQLTLPALFALDHLQAQIVEELREKRNLSPLALEFRRQNELYLRQLFTQISELQPRPAFDALYPPALTPDLFSGEPRHQYLPFFIYGKYLSILRQLVIIPDISSIPQPALDSIYGPNATTASVLDALTPDLYHRRLKNPQKTYNPHDPAEVMGLIGKVLSPFMRELIDQVRTHNSWDPSILSSQTPHQTVEAFIQKTLDEG